MVLIYNPMISTSELVHMMDRRAIGRIIEAATMEIQGDIRRVFIVAEMADHVAKMVAEMIMSIETEVVPMKNANFLKNELYLHLHRLWQLVNSKWQQLLKKTIVKVEAVSSNCTAQVNCLSYSFTILCRT